MEVWINRVNSIVLEHQGMRAIDTYTFWQGPYDNYAPHFSIFWDKKKTILACHMTHTGDIQEIETLLVWYFCCWCAKLFMSAQLFAITSIVGTYYCWMPGADFNSYLIYTNRILWGRCRPYYHFVNEVKDSLEILILLFKKKKKKKFDYCHLFFLPLIKMISNVWCVYLVYSIFAT